MARPEAEAVTGPEPAASEEIAAMSAMAQSMTVPMLAVLLAEAEALALMMPGTPAAPEPVRPVDDAEPFDNVPL